MKYIGVEETTYQVLVDAKIVLKKIKRYKYQKSSGEIIIADMPYRPFAKSAVSSSIVSEVLVQKYVDAMPIYRQEQAWKRLGVEFPYSSLSDMQRMGYNLIKPLFDEFWKVYPRKEAKKNAIAAYNKAKADPEIIIGKVKSLVAGGWKEKEIQFIPMPASWLNAERWNDETQPSQSDEKWVMTSQTVGGEGINKDGLTLGEWIGTRKFGLTIEAWRKLSRTEKDMLYVSTN
jgi:hypothetical protein